MTYRVDYRETVALSEQEHQTVISAVSSWADGAANRRFPYYQRHREQGETELHVIIENLTYQEVSAMQDAIKTGLDSLPGTWPDPTTDAVINNE